MQTYTYDQIADYLKSGYWGGHQHTLTPAQDVAGGPRNVITYDFGALNADGQSYALQAFDVWEDASGLNFRQARPWETANITFSDDLPGAFASHPGRSNTSIVNISSDWIRRDDGEFDTYSMQTYIHEIGHALGLGHAGKYNGTANYGTSNHYENDSWQASVMSYFDQTENTSIDASFAYAVTPQIADILAIQSLYGTTSLARAGNTTYGNNSNAGGIWDQVFISDHAVTATIIDSGGYDTLDFSTWSEDQKIDMRGESISDVAGLTGNLMIARDTRIEAALSGAGDDTVIANNGDNHILTFAGDDYIDATRGFNVVRAGDGNDHILSSGKGQYFGEDGNDYIKAAPGTQASGRIEYLDGGAGVDRLDLSSFNGTYHVNLETGATNWRGETFVNFENVTMGNGDDRVTGTAADNHIYLADGNDVAYSGSGNDTVTAGHGDDTVYSGTGDDVIYAGYGENYVNASFGNDMIHSSGKGTYLGGWGDDTIRAGTGTHNSGREEKLFGGAGTDTLDLRTFNGTYHVNLETGATNWRGETFLEFENVILGNGSDQVTGTAGANVIWSGGGADWVYAGGGADDIYGQGGNDRLFGGEGSDTFHFALGGGRDAVYDFQDGFDMLSFSGSSMSFDNLTIATRDWGSEVLFGETDGIQLFGVAATDLGQDDFFFV